MARTRRPEGTAEAQKIQVVLDRPKPSFASTTFEASLGGIRTTASGEMIVSLHPTFSQHQAVFALDSAYGLMLRVTIERKMHGKTAGREADSEPGRGEESDPCA